MLEVTNGNIFESGAEALVNPVNCSGVMGAGLAAKFRERFPENFRDYERACRRDEVRPGRMLIVEIPWHRLPRYIINFPTKRDWNGMSRIEDIEAGLEHLREVIRAYNISSVAVPALGCGLGGLKWQDVEPRIREALSPLDDVRICVFRPHIKAENRDLYRYLLGI